MLKSFAQDKQDSTIFSEKYLEKNISYKEIERQSPETLIERIKPSKKYEEIEFNIYSQGWYDNKQRNIKRLKNRNLDEYSVLSKSNIGMGSICIPGSCRWYISAKPKFGFVRTINTKEKLKKFVGLVDNEYDAWLILASLADFHPIYPYGKFSKVVDGYLILIPEYNGGGHSEDFSNDEMIYLVTTNGEIYKLK